MFEFLKFARDEDGAVTVDWVVVCAGLVGIAIALTTIVGNASHDHAERVEDKYIEQGIMSFGRMDG
jgi:Flp pilus assembly pilin Flp